MILIPWRWLPGLIAWVLISMALHSVWRSSFAFVVAIPLGIVCGFLFYEAVWSVKFWFAHWRAGRDA